MAASTSSQRRLRGVVADLASRSASDIEAVWHALSEQEREQLRPLLAEAASTISGTPFDVASTLQASPSGTSDEVVPQETAASSLARLVDHWPDFLLLRAIEQLNETQRSRCLAFMPAGRLEALSRHQAQVAITPRAREALLSAACHDANALPALSHEAPRTAPPPLTWRQRLLQSLRKRQPR